MNRQGPVFPGQTGHTDPCAKGVESGTGKAHAVLIVAFLFVTEHGKVDVDHSVFNRTNVLYRVDQLSECSLSCWVLWKQVGHAVSGYGDRVGGVLLAHAIEYKQTGCRAAAV